MPETPLNEKAMLGCGHSRRSNRGALSVRDMRWRILQLVHMMLLRAAAPQTRRELSTS